MLLETGEKLRRQTLWVTVCTADNHCILSQMRLLQICTLDMLARHKYISDAGSVNMLALAHNGPLLVMTSSTTSQDPVAKRCSRRWSETEATDKLGPSVPQMRLLSSRHMLICHGTSMHGMPLKGYVGCCQASQLKYCSGCHEWGPGTVV